MKFIGYRTLKTGIGAAAAMTIAMALGLKYAAAAGIITILSLQSTKKQSVIFAMQRMGACVLALFLSSVLFILFGYNTITFGLFLLVFIPLTTRLRLNEGIVVNSVLVTHLLTEKNITEALIINELGLMIIGVGIALFLNLYIPSIENKIKEDQEYIENAIKDILSHMSVALKACAVSINEEDLFKNLEERLKIGRKRAYSNFNNALFSDNSYYAKYMDMRLQQLNCLKNMRRHFERFSISYTQNMMIADFTARLSESIHQYNTAEGLVKSLQQLRDSFKQMELPKTREEFENRAMLYQFLNDLEQFLLIKNEFKRNIHESIAVDLY